MKFSRISDIIIYQLLKKEIENALWKSQEERIIEEQDGLQTEEYVHNKEINSIIRNFTSTFQRNFTKKQTRHMNYKLNHLKIREEATPKVVGKYISLGNYNSTHNVITIIHLSHPKMTKLLQEETYDHELLHMASTVRTKDCIYVGFEIPGIIGKMLNEGYTEYLTRKYFTRGNEYVQTNDIGVIFAKGIENIIGEKKMQEYYFAGNLNQLMEDLAKYSSREKAMKLLFAMDRLDSKFKDSTDIEDIIKEITRMNKRKLDMEYEEGLLSIEDYTIESIIKVNQYRRRNLWSEETIVVETDDSFYLSDQGYKSKIYKKQYVKREKEKCKQKV